MKSILARVAIALTALVCTPALAATITAASCSQSDVNTAYTSASNGDTVEIPNGSCTWTSGISITKYIVLRAQNYTATSGGSTSRNVTITHNAGSSTLLAFTTASGNTTQLSGIAFIPGASGVGKYASFGGTGVPLINDCYFDVDASGGGVSTYAMSIDTNGAVLWNNWAESSTTSGTGSTRSWFVHKSSKSWTDSNTWGTNDSGGTNKVYVEDSTIYNMRDFAFDGDDNSRSVFRYNTIRNSQLIHHGTTSLQGGREMELYNNAFQYRQNQYISGWVNLNRYIWLRAGTLRATNNSFEEINSSGFYATRTSIVFIAESLTRSGSGSGCETEPDYPGTHWPGQGGNGSTQSSDPIYLYNNSGTGGSGTSKEWGTNDQSPDTCGGGTTANVVLSGRDVLFTNPSYTTYTYPHPLRTAGGGPAAPTNIRIIGEETNLVLQ